MQGTVQPLFAAMKLTGINDSPMRSNRDQQITKLPTLLHYKCISEAGFFSV